MTPELRKALREAVEAQQRYDDAIFEEDKKSALLGYSESCMALVDLYRDELLSLVGGWIPVGERLPELEQEVYYYAPDINPDKAFEGKYLGQAEVEPTGNQQFDAIFGGKHGFCTGDVTHWMPRELPAPPTEDDDG